MQTLKEREESRMTARFWDRATYWGGEDYEKGQPQHREGGNKSSALSSVMSCVMLRGLFNFGWTIGSFTSPLSFIIWVVSRIFPISKFCSSKAFYNEQDYISRSEISGSKDGLKLLIHIVKLSSGKPQLVTFYQQQRSMSVFSLLINVDNILEKGYNLTRHKSHFTTEICTSLMANGSKHF